MTMCGSLDEVRRNIDRLDREIVVLLAERSQYVRQAARFKPTRSDIVVPARIEEIVTRVRHVANELGADPELMEKIYRAMIDAFIWHEARAWADLHGSGEGGK
ncbi:MAG: chorismate mutase [Alphaproteobacteria bacterium]